ncbi:uncharacterized protein GLRG_03122 [Colletotrichum graminicola M1.001]|uniref:Uncharacterized protein n=1 Tax=Colletotrichum graminicola (strain M1.001 / M2 / FGSC 10212) TaxID=645133 RepID=E3QAU0_COLGM|nr:uncharacterized protein GLRG_03122 [Colletotrichum graminicola M1.001]EFQ27978.1 hypothetical protein GLRG_03122 [Colletotrichum graminicola M1.001]
MQRVAARLRFAANASVNPGSALAEAPSAAVSAVTSAAPSLVQRNAHVQTILLDRLWQTGYGLKKLPSSNPQPAKRNVQWSVPAIQFRADGKPQADMGMIRAGSRDGQVQ